MRRIAVSFSALLLLVAVPALAQEEPPARVGRVSFVEGQLAFHTAGETSWSAAAVNYPVATGGSFWADPKSRAEMRIGSQTISLSGNAEVDVVRLDEQVMQLAVPQGRIELRLRSLSEGNTVEIDIPRGGTWLLQPGTYDIDAGTADQPARIMVLDGSAHFTGGAVDIALKTGDTAVIAGTDTLTASLEHAAPDAFAEWCRSRDYREDRLTAPKYVSPRMTGYEELDQYGSWASSPDYGQVWYPSSMPADWAPYRDGHWAWVQPWGWTWVDAQPWGFAPFHYGRWARIDDRWGWVPGRLVPQPVYAPALVAFVGGGAGGFAVAGARGPAVGWFPLAPNEVYWPSYTRNQAYIRSVNVTNVSQTKITNITNIVNRPNSGPPQQIVNQNFANRAAATVVPVRTFATAAKVAPAALRVPPQTLQNAAVSVRPPQALTPTRTAVGPAPAHPAGTPAIAGPAIAPAGHPAGTAAAPEKPPGVHPPGVATTTAPAIAPPGQPSGHPAAATLPATRGPVPAIEHAAPAAAAHAPPPAMHAPPPVEHAAPAAAAHAPPPAMHAPPPVEHAAPAAAAHAPPAAAAVRAPPPAMHAPPSAAPHPAAAAPQRGGQPAKKEDKKDENK